jgi:hypothetical protein
MSTAMEKSAIYGRGLTVVLLQLIPKMPDVFTVTSLSNAVLLHTREQLDANGLDLLRRRIKVQMEYMVADKAVKARVIEQEGQTPPYITQYEKL